jgi:ATP-dependent Lon protease
VLQLLKLPDGTVKVLVEGAARARSSRFTDTDDYYEAEIEVAPDEGEPGRGRGAGALGRRRVRELREAQQEGLARGRRRGDADRGPSKLADTVASHLAIKIADKQELLEIPRRRAARAVSADGERDLRAAGGEAHPHRVKRQMEKTQREYYLNEQMKAIQKELGDEDGRDELAELEEKIKKTKLSKEARDKATAELKKLRQMSPMSAEATVVRNYLDWMLSIPWKQALQDQEGSGLAQTCSTTIISASRRSRSASSSISPCSSAPTS